MWQCAKCGEQNDDQFEACWNCKEAVEGIDPDETQLDILFDPEKPQPVTEAGSVQCPTCGQHFNVQVRKEDGTQGRQRGRLPRRPAHPTGPGRRGGFGTTRTRVPTLG